MVEAVESDVRRDSEQRKESFAVEPEEKAWNKLQHDTENHKKRIKDLIELAQESRERIDALLGRKTTRRDEFDDDDVAPLPSASRGSHGGDGDERSGSRRGSRDSDGSRHSDRSDNERSDAERRGSRGSRKSRDDDAKRQETSEQVIQRTAKKDVGVGNFKITTNIPAASPSSAPPPKVKPKPPMKKAKISTSMSVDMSPKLIKKPFKFGMVSLQVKLDE